MINSDYFTSDILEFIRLMDQYEVAYVIVGGEAVIYYGYPRLTGDIDLFYENSDTNVNALFKALLEFWEGDIPGIHDKTELTEPGYIIQFGVPPNRIDLLNEIEGVDFEKAWLKKKTERIQIADKLMSLYFLSLEHLIINKEKTGRPKDLDDLDYLKNVE